MQNSNKIAYRLLALFLTLYGLDPLPMEAMDIADHGPHRIWTVAAHVPPAWDTPGFYKQLSCELWEYVAHHNSYRGAVRFQPYDLEDYPNGNGRKIVRASIYQ